MPDNIPGADGNFDSFAEGFSSYVSANAGALGVPAATATEIANKLAEWGSAYGNQQQLVQALPGATETKNNRRVELEALIRPVIKSIQARPQTTNEQRAALGITIPDGSRSRAPIPSSRPIIVIDSSHRLEQTLVLRDENSITSRSRPQGVIGAEVYCFINGTPPTDPKQCKLVAVAKKSTVKVKFDGVDAGKNAFFMVRWINSHDEAGPWSETVAATIAA